MQLTNEQKQELKLLIELERRECEASLYTFVKRAFTVLNPSSTFKDNWHIEYICGEIQGEVERILRKEPAPFTEIIINVPPRTLKSEIVSVCLPVWAWIKDPSFKLICSSYSLPLGRDLAIKGLSLAESDWFKTMWGNKIQFKSTSADTTRTTGQGARYTTSTGGTVTGMGGLIVIQDDPLSPKQANSALERGTANTFRLQTLASRLDDPEIGVFITIMQRLHADDPTGAALENIPKVKHISLPAELTKNSILKLPDIDRYISKWKKEGKPLPYDNPDKLLFPRRLSKDWLEMQATTMTETDYAGQYLQSPIAGSGNIIDVTKFIIMTWEDFHAQYLSNRVSPTWNFYADLASTTKNYSDPSAICSTATVDNMVVIRALEASKINPAYLPKWIEVFARRHGYTNKSFVNIEPRDSGNAIIATTKKETTINVRALKYAVKGINNNSDKVARAIAAQPIIESGRVILIQGLWLEKFLDQAAVFPNGRNDDQVDVVVASILNSEFGKRYGSMGISRTN